MIFNYSSAYYFQDELQALTLMPRPYKRAMQIEILKPEYASRLVTIVGVLGLGRQHRLGYTSNEAGLPSIPNPALTFPNSAWHSRSLSGVFCNY